MKKTIAIDSNALTYFIGAIESAYDPSLDTPNLAAQKVAMLRIYFYRGEPFYIVPTVEQEYKRITEDGKRNIHGDVHSILLLDFIWDIDENEIIKRANSYSNFHPDPKDCRIVAEAELGGIEVLLSFDRQFINRLRHNTVSIVLMQPSDYWNILNIAPGTRPILSPHKSNPLSHKTWWLI